MKKILIALALFTLCFSLLKAKDNTDSSELGVEYGIYGRYSLLGHSPSFRRLPDVPCCGSIFTSGTGKGFEIGGIIGSTGIDPFSFDIRLGYRQYSGLLKKTDDIPVIVDGESYSGKSELMIDSKFSLLTLEPTFSYKFLKNLSAFVGMQSGFLLDNTYHQKEEIIDPSDRGVFENGKRIRNDSTGKIPDVLENQVGFIIGLSYELPMTKRNYLSLTPEISYSLLMTNIVKEIKWGYQSVNLGLSIKYRKPDPLPPPPPPPLPPPMPQYPAPRLPKETRISVQAIQIDENKNESSNPFIRVEDFITYNMRPLLNYIFFDENSSALPNRYVKLKQEETADFDINKLHNLNTLETYHEALNVIGKRLQDNPKANITVSGTNSNLGKEKGNLALSEQRAKTVSDYLTEVWKVDKSRIKILARNLPQEASRSDIAEGEEENRRVEISSNDNSIFEPVFSQDTTRILSSANFKFINDVKSEFEIKKWDLDILHDNTIIKSFQGEGMPPEEILWELSNETENTKLFISALKYRLYVKDALGSVHSTQENIIPIEHITIDKKRIEGSADKEFEYYSLILFDYGKFTLSSAHKKVIDFVKKRVSPNSTISIIGYTDKIGDEEINDRISTNRAKSVAKLLDFENAETYGLGKRELLFDNSLPEGRFYCRTVRISIETPIEKQ
ncbi:MAG: OmpA family protein [Ignavibacteria bacterium]|nr:OmpA family protein [Ignavibacteria bacterium]